MHLHVPTSARKHAHTPRHACTPLRHSRPQWPHASRSHPARPQNTRTRICTQRKPSADTLTRTRTHTHTHTHTRPTHQHTPTRMHPALNRATQTREAPPSQWQETRTWINAPGHAQHTRTRTTHKDTHNALDRTVHSNAAACIHGHLPTHPRSHPQPHTLAQGPNHTHTHRDSTTPLLTPPHTPTPTHTQPHTSTRSHTHSHTQPHAATHPHPQPPIHTLRQAPRTHPGPSHHPHPPASGKRQWQQERENVRESEGE